MQPWIPINTSLQTRRPFRPHWRRWTRSQSLFFRRSKFWAVLDRDAAMFNGVTNFCSNFCSNSWPYKSHVLCWANEFITQTDIRRSDKTCKHYKTKQVSYVRRDRRTRTNYDIWRLLPRFPWPFFEARFPSLTACTFRYVCSKLHEIIHVIINYWRYIQYIKVENYVKLQN